MAIYYITRILSEDGEVLLEDFGAQYDLEALNTHDELIELVKSGDLAREAEVPQDATLTVQTYRVIDDRVIAESRLEHSGEHYEVTQHYEVTRSIGYW